LSDAGLTPDWLPWAVAVAGLVRYSSDLYPFHSQRLDHLLPYSLFCSSRFLNAVWRPDGDICFSALVLQQRCLFWRVGGALLDVHGRLDVGLDVWGLFPAP
jgi:hypothetical protein